MSYIPNTRKIYDDAIFQNKGKREHGYYQGYLDEDSKRELRAYDLATEEMGMFFDNLHIYEEDFQRAFNIYDLDIDYSVFGDTDVTEEDFDKLNLVTKVLATVEMCLKSYIEMGRNQFVVSMIEGMDEEVYETNRKKVLESEGENNGCDED